MKALRVAEDVETVHRALRMLEGVATVIGAVDYDPITDAYLALNRLQSLAEKDKDANDG